MQVRMSVGQAIQFLKSHEEAIECQKDDSWLSHIYDLKLACAIETLISAMDKVVELHPEIVRREHIEEFKIINKWL